jgi:hypothetical protein
VQIVAIHNHIFHVDADAHQQRFVIRFLVSIEDRALHIACPNHRVDDTAEFDQQTVANRPDEAAVVLRYFRRYQILAQGSPLAGGVDVVLLDQAAETGNVGKRHGS